MRNSIRVFALTAVALVALGAEPAAAPAAPDNGNNTSALKARMDMRRVWSDHATLTRAYIVSAASDKPDTEALAKRMEQNADDLAGALGQYYSDAVRARLSTLFRMHATLFSDAVSMAKTNEKDEMTSVQDKLETNGRETIAFLCSLNPRWDEATLRGEFEQHVNRENDELTALVQQGGMGDLVASDEAQKQIVEFADMLSSGIERQFPDRFVAN